MKSLFKILKDESGQGVIEYVLVLMVVIGIVLGGLYQLNTAFQVFADSYFGDYLACLLETGELPALDGVGGTCNASFQAFSLASGRPLVSLSGGGSSSSGGALPGGGSTGGGYTGVGGSAAAAAANGQSNSFSIGRSTLPPPPITKFAVSRGAGGKSAGADTGDISATDVQGYQGTKVIHIHRNRFSEGIAGQGFTSDEEKEKQKVSVTPTAQALAEQKRKELMRIERKPAAAKTAEIEEFTFSNFLRYLIIAAIVIAILFFIGSQAMQVSKSME